MKILAKSYCPLKQISNIFLAIAVLYKFRLKDQHMAYTGTLAVKLPMQSTTSTSITITEMSRVVVKVFRRPKTNSAVLSIHHF